jgi:DNA-binding NarL/FixJ family response regulator
MFIVDDSEILRSRLVQMLSEIEGLEIVGQAGFVRDAVREIRRLNPDIAIIDMRMPDGSGIDILAAIKKDKMVTRVIVFTNYPYLQYRKKCLDAGADFFFYKATELDKLINLLKELLLRQKKN